MMFPMKTSHDADEGAAKKKPGGTSRRSAMMAARQQRVDEYEENGLRSPDAMDACLAAVQADLMRVSFKLGPALEQALATPPINGESLRDIAAPLDMYLRVTRQIDRIGQLDLRRSEVQQVGAAAQEAPQANGMDQERRQTPK
jgi:hypothetical protein